MATKHDVEIGIGLKFDQASLNEAKKSLESLQQIILDKSINTKLPKDQLEAYRAELRDINSDTINLGNALERAFNPNLNTINLQTLNSSLKATGTTVHGVITNFTKLGVEGQQAAVKLATSLMTTNQQLVKSETVIDKMAVTLGNTIKWNIASAAINKIAGSMQQATGYVKSLDNSLNDIRIVTGKSADEMERFAKQVNNAAKTLGTTTVKYVKASLTFYQQGLSDEEVKTRTDLTTKVSNVTGLSSEDSSQYVTAVLNGYKVGSEEAEATMDKLAAVGATTASSLSELSEGMAKVASTANAMGVSEDQLAASLATVVSVTRQEASSVGTAFKTIYARISDIKAGSDEAEISLGNYTKKMADMGFSVLDASGNMRDLGEVMEEIGNSWADLSREQQISLAQTMAGTRQYNNLIALFDNWDEYQKSLNVSMNANGTLQAQQNIYLESTAAHLKQVTAASEDLWDSLIDAKDINNISDALAKSIKGVSNWVDALGGGKGVLLALGSVATTVFSKQIAGGLNKAIQNTISAKEVAAQYKQQIELINNTYAAATQEKSAKAVADVSQKASLLMAQEASTKEEADLKGQLLTTYADSRSKFIPFEEGITKLSDYSNKLEEAYGIKLNFSETSLFEEGADTIQIVDNYTNALFDVNKQLDDAAESAKEFGKLTAEQLAEVNDVSKDAGKSFSNLTKSATSLQKMLPENAESVQKYNEALTRFQEQQSEENKKTVIAAFEEMRQEVNDINTDMAVTMSQEFAQGAQQAKESVDAAAEQIQRKINSIQAEKFMQGVLRAAGGLSQVTSGIMTLSRVSKTLTDESLSTGEKTVQVVQALATGVPMLIMGVNAFVSSLSEIKDNFGGFTKQLALMTKKGAEMGAAGIEAQGAWAALGPTLLGLLPYIAAIAALVGIGYAIARAVTADQRAFEQANQALENCKNTYKELKDEADKFKQTVDDYNSILDKFYTLDSAADDYKETLIAVNDKAKELIETYNLLGKYHFENGVIVIDEDALEEAKQLMQEDARMAQQRAIAMERYQLQTEEQQTLANFEKKAWTVEAHSAEDQAMTLEVNKTIDKYREKFKALSQQYLISMVDQDAEINRIKNSDIFSDKSDNDIKNISSAAQNIMLEQQDAWITEHANLQVGRHDTNRDLDIKGSLWTWTSGDENLARAYAEEVLGYSKEEAAGAVYKGGKNQGSLSINGKEVFKELSDDTMRTEIAVARAEKEFAKKNPFDVDASLEEINNSIETLYKNAKDKMGDEGLDLADAIVESFSKGKIQELDLSSYLLDVSPDEIEDLKQNGKTLIEGLISDDGFKDFGYKSADQFIKAFEDGLAKYNEADFWRAKTDNSQQNVNLITSLLEAAENGEDLTGEDYIAGLDKLEKKYKDLGEIQNKNSYEYLKRLREIREEEEALTKENKKRAELETQNQLNAKKEEVEKLKDKINNPETGKDERRALEAQLKVAEGEEAKLQKQLDDYHFEVKASLDADLESDINSAFGLANDISKIGNYITDDLKLTMDQAKAIMAAGYGEILVNAKETADGQIQMDAAVVEAFKANMKEQLDAERNARIEELELERQSLEAQKKILIAKGEALKTARMAENEDERNAALVEATVLEANYQNELAALEAKVNSVNDAANEEAKINEELYNDLTNAYEQDATNQATALDIKLGDVSSFAEKAVEYYNKVAEAADMANKVGGGAEYKPVSFTSSGEGANFHTDSSGIQTKKVEIKYNYNDGQLAELKNQIKEKLKGISSEEINATLDALIKDNDKRVQAIIDQLGSVDAAIAFLKSSGNAFDEAGIGGGSGAAKKLEEHLESVWDRYHDIDIEIKNITRDLAALQKQQSLFSGTDLIDNLNKQLTALGKQREIISRKLEIAYDEQKELQGKLAAYGATYDKDGQISNYKGILDQALARVNAKIDWYNSLSEEQQTEAAKQELEAEKKRYTDLQKYIQDYDKVVNDTIAELKEQITEALMQEIEIQAQKFNLKLSISLDMTQAERDWNDFQKKVIDRVKDDDYAAIAEYAKKNYLTYYDTEGTGSGSVQAGTEHINTILEELRKMDAGEHSNIYSAYDEATDTWVDNRAKAIEDLKSAFDSTKDSMEALVDLEDEIEQAFLNSIDAIQAAFDKQNEIYSFFGDQIEHDMTMLKLLYGEDSYAKIADYYDKQLESNEAQVKNYQDQAEYWKKLMEEARDAGDTEAYEKYRDNWMATIGSLNSAIEAWANTLKDRYANAIDEVLQELNDKLTDGMGLDYVNNQMTLMKKTADMYLDDINATYAVQKLQNKWQQSIDAATSVSTQAKLTSLMQEQMKMLREKDKLTKYDVERAEKEYEIALKQIALQDAQMNKSTMRLKRDANGNYSYVYAADDDAIAKAEQDLADAQNDLYNFDKDAYQKNLEDVYSVWAEFQEKVKNAYIEYGDDQERLTQELALLQETYGEQINILTANNLTIRGNLEKSAFQSLASLYDTDYKSFEKMTNEEKDLILNDLVPNWNSGIQSMIDKIKAEGGFEPTCTTAFTNLTNLAEEFRKKLEEVKKITEETTDEVDKQEVELKKDAEAMVDAAKKTRDAVADVRTEVKGLIKDYEDLKEACLEALEAAEKYMQEEKKRTKEAADNPPSPVTPGGPVTPNTPSTPTTPTNPNPGDERKKEDPEVEYERRYKAIIVDRNGIKSEDNNGGQGWTSSDLDNIFTNKVKDGFIRSYSKQFMFFRKVTSLATGGYTGNWNGNEGKLAMLHKKELVLNATDTQNILDSVSIMRELMSALHSNLASSLGDKLGKVIGITPTSGNSNKVEQYVHIDAEFHDATTAAEITSAFENLVNVAYQRSYAT